MQSTTPVVKHYKMMIGGEFVDSSSEKTFQVVYPYDMQPWAEVPRGTPQDVDAAVQAAEKAFEETEWARDPPMRAKVLRKFAESVSNNARYLAELETRQNGKLIREMEAQMRGLPDYYYYFAGFADKIDGRTIPARKDMLIYTMREPVGVVAAITPWNSPLLLLTLKLAPGLAAGNAFVVKPSKYTPVSTLELCRLGQEAGVPQGILNVVTGFSGDIGDALVRHPSVAKVAFTGSTDSGIDIMKKAADTIKRTTLELGGKSPNIVFDSASFDEAVSGVVSGIFAATGQTCIAGSRLLVQDSIYDEFMKKLVERTKAIKLGDPMNPESEMGTVAFPDQLQKVQRYVDVASKEGATVLAGGKRATGQALDKGLFFEPTILGDVKNDMTVAREEIFGPVLSAIRFKTEDEAVAIGNKTMYGLAAGIWSQNIRQAHRVARRLKAGTVWINCYRSVSYCAPFGGYKMSGLGRENGAEVINEYTNVKTVWVELTGRIRDPFKMG